MTDAPLSFMGRLKRHHIFRVASAYAVTAYILILVANAVFPDIGLSRADVRYIIAMIALLFPVALVLGWMFIPPSKENPDKFSHWQRLRFRVGSALTLVIVVLVTVSGIYLWRANVHYIEDTAEATAKTAAAAAIPAKSIAVLPFINEGGHEDERYFSDGLSEDLITALSQFAGLKVISRYSAFQFRSSKEDSAAIGEKLGVAHLLEGSVRRTGSAVRISVELINAADGRALWSEHYDRPYKDLFALQDDITKAVASTLQAKLLVGGNAVTQNDRPPSGNLDAYTAYLQSKFYDESDTEADDRKAIDYYNRAIRLDPRYAQAYAGLSRVWTSHAAQFLSGMDMNQAYAKARAAANTALVLNPNLASVHVARAYLLQSADFDWTGADSEFRRALQLAPEDNTAKFMWGVLLATLGKLEPAVQLTQESLVSDPLHAIWY
ncbi:MAG: tetratricopeptide repeat protein, partial [Gammaproteobacteria bacterium]